MHFPGSRVPFAPPAWLSPQRTAMAAIGVGGLATVALASRHLPDETGALLGRSVVIGLVLRASVAVITATAANATLHPTHDGPDRVLVAAGSWLVVVSGAGAVLARGSLAWLALLLSAIGLIAGATGAWRMRRRAAWLVEVRRGLVPGWEVVPIGRAEDLDLRPLTALPTPLPELGVLRHRPVESPLSYRRAPATLHAIVRLRAGPTAFDLWRSRLEASVLADPLTACLTALLKGVVVSLLVLAATVSITTVLVWCLCATFWG